MAVEVSATADGSDTVTRAVHSIAMFQIFDREVRFCGALFFVPGGATYPTYPDMDVYINILHACLVITRTVGVGETLLVVCERRRVRVPGGPKLAASRRVAGCKPA